MTTKTNSKTAARKTNVAKASKAKVTVKAERKTKAKGAQYRITPLKFDSALVKRVTTCAKKGDSLSAIAKAEHKTKGKVAMALLISTEPKVKYVNGVDLAQKVQKDRKAGISWGVLSARYDVTEGTVRSAFESATGKTFKALDYRKRGGRDGRERTDLGRALARKVAA